LATSSEDPDTPFRIDPVKALIPLVPIALLLAAYSGWWPMGWLLQAPEGEQWDGLANALPVVRAMLIGSLLAAAVAWRETAALTRRLFEGMGTAYAGIISLTITAQCFGAGIAAIGVSEALLGLAGSTGSMALLAGGFPWALATLSGSGSGPVLTFAQAFLSQVDERHDPVTLGAAACFAAAFGRTMSPVAAVVVYSAGLVGLSPLVLVRRVLPALLLGAAVTMTATLIWKY
jgi:DcuC family C4-dicarboxylate transporter